MSSLVDALFFAFFPPIMVDAALRPYQYESHCPLFVTGLMILCSTIKNFDFSSQVTINTRGVLAYKVTIIYIFIYSQSRHELSLNTANFV